MEHNGLDQSTANEIFDAIDYDGNGTIRFSEFVAAAIGDTFTVCSLSTGVLAGIDCVLACRTVDLPHILTRLFVVS